MAVEGDLERAILKHYITARYANVEAPLAPELSHLLDQLLSTVELALQVGLDIVL